MWGRSAIYTIPPLQVASTLKCLVLDNLHPIVIRIQDECHVLHPSIRKALLPVNIQRLEPITGSIEIVDGDTCNHRRLLAILPMFYEKPTR